ncbi:MAG: hypothetical protein ABSG95_10110 [Solirubrobacteraceae bacterium]|jgi:rubrerythrin
MIRPSLPSSLAERRHARRRRRSRGATPAAQRESDEAVQRVRAAGGPLDHASYTCSCGYLFVASVSTTVRCPHCGVGQAW